MPNLIDQLGARYVREFFHGAYFRKDDKAHSFDTIDENTQRVITRVIDLRSGNPRWVVSDSIRYDDLKDFTAFKYPKLGYRQFPQNKMGTIVVHCSTTRNAYRGLRNEVLNYNPLPVFEALGDVSDSFDAVNDARRIKELFNPTFTSFSAGIKLLLDGAIAGFAVSEDVACGISVEQGRLFDVYFRGRAVGSVDERGNLTLTNKVLQRDSIRRKLFA